MLVQHRRTLLLAFSGCTRKTARQAVSRVLTGRETFNLNTPLCVCDAVWLCVHGGKTIPPDDGEATRAQTQPVAHLHMNALKKLNILHHAVYARCAGCARTAQIDACRGAAAAAFVRVRARLIMNMPQPHRISMDMYQERAVWVWPDGLELELLLLWLLGCSTLRTAFFRLSN